MIDKVTIQGPTSHQVDVQKVADSILNLSIPINHYILEYVLSLHHIEKLYWK